MSVIKFNNKGLDPKNIKGWFIDAFIIYKAGILTHTFYMLYGLALSYLAFTLLNQYLKIDISIIKMLAPFFSPIAFFYFYSNICKKDVDIPFSNNHKYFMKGLIFIISIIFLIALLFFLTIYSLMHILEISIDFNDVDNTTGKTIFEIMNISLTLISNPLLFPTFALYGFFNINIKESLFMNNKGSFHTGNNILYLLSFYFISSTIETILIQFGIVGYFIFICFIPYFLCFNHVLFKEIYLDISPNKSLVTSKIDESVYQKN